MPHSSFERDVSLTGLVGFQAVDSLHHRAHDMTVTLSLLFLSEWDPLVPLLTPTAEVVRGPSPWLPDDGQRVVPEATDLAQLARVLLWGLEPTSAGSKILL